MTWLRSAALLIAFGIAATVMFPLRVAWGAAAPSADLAVAGVDGTIWNGRFTGVAWRGVALGDFDVSMPLLDLLPGPALRLENGSGPLQSAVVRGGGGAIEIREAHVSVAFAAVSAAAPPDLAARISGAALTLRGSRCTHAAGQVASPPAPALGMPAFSGSLTCENGSLLADLNSDAGDVVLELSPGLDRIAYRSASPAIEVALAAIGIEKAGARR